MKNSIYDHVSIRGDASAVFRKMEELKEKGWTNLRYAPNNRDCDCSADEIDGYRPMTGQEIKERNLAIKKMEKEEILMMKSLAKKYGYVVSKK